MNEKLTIAPVGVSFYQDKIKLLKKGEKVHFKHIPAEFNHVKYPNAIQIQTGDGTQVGSIQENADPQGLQSRIVAFLAHSLLEGIVMSVSDISDLGLASDWTFSVSVELPAIHDGRGEWEMVETFTGETIFYNDEQHKYKDENDNVLVGGSTWCKQFYPEFPMAKMSKTIADKYMVNPQVIKDVWASNGKLSMMGGSTLHYAMEHYFRYKGYAFVEKGYHLPNDPWYLRAVESFPDALLRITPEVFVSCVERRIVGQVDALIENVDGSYSIGDYKTGKEKNLVKKKREEYFLQLGYYAMALHLNDMKVKELILYYFYDGAWTVYRQDFKPLDV